MPAPYAVFAFKFKNAIVTCSDQTFFLNKLHAEIKNKIKLAFYIQTPS